MEPLLSLVLANAGFVGSHLLMSHPLRAPLVTLLGERGFMLAYTIVSFGFFWWIVVAFRQSMPAPLPWDGTALATWVLASLLTIVATALFLGSIRGNPALPEMGEAAATAEAHGAFAVTRHPMMWSFALWAVAHILAWPSPRTIVTAGAMGFLALVGSYLQDGKKERLLGDAWRGWEAKTSYWPRLGALAKLGIANWMIAIALWLGLTWLHMALAGLPAGVWIWLG